MNIFLVHLASVALLALLVEVACRLGRFRPALCHALWLVVLVKLVVPPVVAWPVSPAAIHSAYTAAVAPASEAGLPSRESVARAEFAQDTTPVEENAAADRPVAAALLVDWARPLAMGLWLFGAVLVTGRIVWEVRRSRRRVARGAPLPAWLQARLEESCQVLGVPVPRAVLTHEQGGVYMQIAGTPALVVSSDSLENVESDRWHTLLTHELAHLKRRDHWVAWLTLAAGVVWWWNPLFWCVRHRIHLFSEMACDAWVVNVHPGDRKQYAETMVRIMTMLSRQDVPAPAMGLAAWSAATQERRLWMIMKAKGACNVPWGSALALGALAVLAAPSWVAIGAEEASKSEGEAEKAGWRLSLTPSAKVQEILEKPVNIEFEDIHIKDISEFIQDTFELNIVLDQRVVKPEQEEGADPLPDSPKGGKPYATDGMVPYINLKDTPLKDALNAMTRPLQLATQLRGQSLWISTAGQLAADQAVPLPSADFAEGPILTKLHSPVNIEFEDIHIKDIVEFLQDVFEINIVVDGQVVAPEGGDFNTPPLGSPGYATDGMIGYINVKNTPMGEALYSLTRLLNLTYTVTSDYVYITTPERVGNPEVPKAAE